MRAAFLEKPISVLAVGTLLALSLSLFGCSNPRASLMDARAEAASAVNEAAYLPVGVTPPARDQPTLTADEQARLRNELITAAVRQAQAVEARDQN
jgi:hypothetical protein